MADQHRPFPHFRRSSSNVSLSSEGTMSRHRRKRSAHASVPVARTSLARLPIDVHRAWLHHLTQPELLCVGALSKSWRAIVLDEPLFYLAIRLRLIRTHHNDFLQQLSHASRRQLPIGVILDFPYAPDETSHAILSEKISPAIKRSMRYVRKLSISSEAPPPAAAVAFLQVPAPKLLGFFYNISCDVCGKEKDYESVSDSESSSFNSFDWRSPPPAPPAFIFPRLFDHAAPKLKEVLLYGVTLPAQPLPAFARATQVSLGGLLPIPRIGLGAHFPAAEFLEITDFQDGFAKGNACARSAWLPKGLKTFDVNMSLTNLRKLLRFSNMQTVPHVRICFDSHYDDEEIPSLDARGAIWASCLTHLSRPRKLAITTTEWSFLPQSGMEMEADVHVTVDDGTRSVTFYTLETFSEHLFDGTAYDPLSGLSCLGNNLTELSTEHEHLPAIFFIASQDHRLPALRVLHVVLPATPNRPFWEIEDGNECLLSCPSLRRLVLSCNGLDGLRIRSKELAQFGCAIGLPAPKQPRLVLEGVRVKRRTRITSLFAME